MDPISTVEAWFHTVIEPVIVIIDVFFTFVIVGVIIYMLTLKGLNLRRTTSFGNALGDNNLVFAVVYLGVLMASWFPFFRSDPWIALVRISIAVTAIRVILAMRTAYGGWLNLHLRAWLNLKIMLHSGRMWVWDHRRSWRFYVGIFIVAGIIAIVARLSE